MRGDPYTIAGRLTLWFGFFGGPIAWTLHLLVSYSPVEVACDRVGAALLKGITVATVMLALGAAAAGWRAWRRARAAEPAAPADNGTAIRRTRFMGLCGMILGGFFALAILVEGLPVLAVDPCLRLP